MGNAYELRQWNGNGSTGVLHVDEHFAHAIFLVRERDNTNDLPKRERGSIYSALALCLERKHYGSFKVVVPAHRTFYFVIAIHNRFVQYAVLARRDFWG